MTRSGVFLMKFEVFGNVMKHCLEYLTYLLNRNKNYATACNLVPRLSLLLIPCRLHSTTRAEKEREPGNEVVSHARKLACREE